MYIERNHALSVIKTAQDDLVSDYAYSAATMLERYIREMQKLPAAEVAPVVRCKECRHSWFNGTSLWLCQREGKFYCPKVAEDAFCSYGERRVTDGG